MGIYHTVREVHGRKDIALSEKDNGVFFKDGEDDDDGCCDGDDEEVLEDDRSRGIPDHVSGALRHRSGANLFSRSTTTTTTLGAAFVFLSICHNAL